MKTDDLNGFCICLHCNSKISHVRGNPCRAENCPQCGEKMIREGSYHHQLYLSKTGEQKNESSSTHQGKCC